MMKNCYMKPGGLSLVLGYLCNLPPLNTFFIQLEIKLINLTSLPGLLYQLDEFSQY